MIIRGRSKADQTDRQERRQKQNGYNIGIFWEDLKMTVEQFKDLMLCNEPEFGYNGQKYSICSPNGKYYVTATDSPGDAELEFDTLDLLLDCWIIQGRPLREILSDTDLR